MIFSKSYRGLIELCLRNASGSDAESKEEAWHYFEGAANMIEKSEKVDNLSSFP